MTTSGGLLAERVLMTLLLGAIGVGCVLVLYPFLSALLWAGILVFSTWPIFEWLRERGRLPRGVAAALMVLVTAVVIVLPVALAAPGGASDVNQLRGKLEALLKQGLPDAPAWLFDVPVVGHPIGGLWNSWAGDLSSMVDTFRPYVGVIAEGGFSLLLGIVGGVVGFLLALFISFFFYAYGEAIAGRLRAILRRVAGDRAERLIEVTGQTVRGTVYGILGTAIVQGLLTTFGLWIAGVPRPVTLGALAGFLSVFPIGAPLVWIPAGLWLLGGGHTAWGVILLVYGTVAISGSDNVVRPWFIARGAQLPFLVTVLGVLGGALAFGLLGVFLGPVLLAVGFTLVNEWAGEESGQPAPAEPVPVVSEQRINRLREWRR